LFAFSAEDFERYGQASVLELVQSNKKDFIECANEKCSNIIERVAHDDAAAADADNAGSGANGSGEQSGADAGSSSAKNKLKRVLKGNSNNVSGNAKVERGLDNKPLTPEGIKSYFFVFVFLNLNVSFHFYILFNCTPP
jgi:hypothetical protein